MIFQKRPPQLKFFTVSGLRSCPNWTTSKRGYYESPIRRKAIL